MELLHICLERIGWQGEATEWQARLVRALDRIQLRLNSKTEPLSLQITAFQMESLVCLCKNANTGDAEKTLLQALRLCHAFHFSNATKAEWRVCCKASYT